MKHATIIGIGHYVPETVFTNEDFIKKGIDTNDEWIQTRTGIRERRLSGESQPTSELAYEASHKALQSAKLNPADIDMIIVATTSPDHLGFPSVACLLQHKLGCKQVAAFDVSAACTGFSYALTIASQFIQSSFSKNVLVVGADSLTKLMNWEVRGSCILFGDGAGAVILSACESNTGLLYSKLYSEGEYGDILNIPVGGTKTPLTPDSLKSNEHKILMDGKAVFHVAINNVLPAIQDCLSEMGLTASDIDYFLPHQANLRIMTHFQKKLKMKPEQLLSSIETYGNTSAASIPVTLSEAVEKQQLKKNDLILMAGFGAGFTWGINLIRWDIKT